MYVHFLWDQKLITSRPHSANDLRSVTLCCDLLWLAELVESCTQLARVPVIQVLADAQLRLNNREYWIVYRGPVFLVSSPSLSPLSPVYYLLRVDWVRRWERSQIKRRRESLNYILLPIPFTKCLVMSKDVFFQSRQKEHCGRTRLTKVRYLVLEIVGKINYLRQITLPLVFILWMSINLPQAF